MMFLLHLPQLTHHAVFMHPLVNLHARIVLRIILAFDMHPPTSLTSPSAAFAGLVPVIQMRVPGAAFEEVILRQVVTLTFYPSSL